MAIISRITPSSGTLLVEPQEKKEELQLKKEANTSNHLTFGKVLAVGADLITDYGTSISTIAEQGDMILFLTYDSQLDVFGLNNIKYHAVLFRDVRAVLK